MRVSDKEVDSFIKECLLKNAINFAEQHIEIFENGKAIIFHAKKSLPLNSQHVWIKKKGRLFAVTMGAFSGAQICEAVGNFLLYQLSTNCNKKRLVYRNDGLAIFKNVSSSKAGKNKKDIQMRFNVNHLNMLYTCYTM